MTDFDWFLQSFCYVTFHHTSNFSRKANPIFIVPASPEFVTKPQDVTVSLNGLAKFDCVARGNPPPSVFWTKEGSQLLMFPGNSYGRMAISQDGGLTINGVLREDSGFIVCSALSVAGSATARAFLQVKLDEFLLLLF